MSSQTVNYAETNALGLQYVVTATDETDTYVEFLFENEGRRHRPVPMIMVTDSAGVNKPLVDAVITTTDDGLVRIDNGAATFALLEDDIIYVMLGNDINQTF